MGQLITILWRDIPAQVTAKAGRETAKRVLHPRFQVAIDKAAMKAGRRTASEYIEDWRRETRPCDDDLEAEVVAEAARVEAEYTKERLAALVEAGGVDPTRGTSDRGVGPGPAAPAQEADPS